MPKGFTKLDAVFSLKFLLFYPIPPNHLNPLLSANSHPNVPKGNDLSEN